MIFQDVAENSLDKFTVASQRLCGKFKIINLQHDKLFLAKILFCYQAKCQNQILGEARECYLTYGNHISSFAQTEQFLSE